MDKRKLKKCIGITSVLLGAAAVGLTIAAKKKQPDSVYADQPEEQNPLEGKQVAFVENPEDAENADGACGHLEAVADSVPKRSFYDRYIKRALDVALSFGGLVLLSPVYAGIALAIKIDDPGPVLFTQKRVGKNKKYFKLHKFRSMKMSTPHDVPTHMLENPEQYITRVGKFIRAHSLDELPQIWDIFVGNMSVIGPRPGLWNQDVLTAERDRYGANDIKPGLTGWAQINGRDELELTEKARLDGVYAQNESLLFDAKCFLGTVSKVGHDDNIVEGGHKEEMQGRRKKKILIITNHSYMLWRFRRELIAALMQDHEVVLSMPFVGHEEDFQAMGLRCINTIVDRRGINPKTDLKLMQTYERMLKQEKPDLVITYSIKPNVYAGLMCTKHGIPFCANVQGLGTAFEKPDLAQFVTVLYKAAFRKVRTVFFENEADAEEFRKRGIIGADRRTVLHGAGINLEYYALQPYPQNDKVHFLYLGRIMQEKGMDELFEAMRRVHAQRLDTVLDLVGFYEDEYEAKVQQLVDDGIAVFHGFQSEPQPYYAAADCVVLPSYHEGMSNVLLEAAATGRPIICSDIPGCREAVEADVSGLLCKVKDADSLYEAMLSMAERDPEARSAMGLAGRKRMEVLFDKKAIVAETIAALRLN